MTSPALPAIPQSPSVSTLFGDFWPEPASAPRPRLLLASLVAGLIAAAILPFRDAGIGTFVVLVAVAGVVVAADPRRRSAYHLLALTLCALLLSTVFLRDADWIVTLCVLAALVVAVATLTETRTLVGLVTAGASVPFAALRGLPWLARSARVPRAVGSWVPALRTVCVSLALVLVFGLLFASADALFASWAGAVLPDITAPTLVLRTFITLAVAGVTLVGVYVALNPPQVERAALPAAKPVTRPFEWLVPVGAVAALFAIFVVAQLAVMFGGHDYLRRTTGLTYADYVHQGFGQLTFATLLTLGVVGVAARKAPRSTASERLLLRAVLGVLCLLTLVVVASALYRMHVYEEAYGFTRLRLLVSVFEGWLGVVVLLVMGAGLRLRGAWVLRAAVLTGAASLLALAAINPDAYIATHNLDRYAETGKVDTLYLSELSADAVPALSGSTVPPACLANLSPRSDDDWLEWNLGRQRAAGSLSGSAAADEVCPALP